MVLVEEKHICLYLVKRFVWKTSLQILGQGAIRISDSDVTNELHFTLCEEKFPCLSDDKLDLNS